MSERHLGLRRRQSKLPIAWLLVLAVALAGVIRLLTLSDPAVAPTTTTGPLTNVVPTWSGPAPVNVPGGLADGDAYTPRLFLTADTSAGVATSPDGTVRVLLVGPGQATELRRLSPTDHAQVNGFAFGGDALVWMETLSRTGAATTTTLWRTTWRSATKPVLVTANTGEATFYGLQSDVVIQDGRANWAASAADAAVTDVRSVALTGGQVSTKRLEGEFALTTWPWAVSVTGGKGVPVTLINLTTDARVGVTTNPDDVAACGPAWCRLIVSGATGLVGIDLVRTDGTQRRRIAGAEATPTIADATLLDRYVPLATDSGGGGPGLSLYDLSTGQTELVAVAVANVQGRDGVMWWSTGVGAALVWHAVDLRTLS